MKAMILAAGFGTRLRPLSDCTPKSLMPVANKPVLLRNLEYLQRLGVEAVVVNAHHHADQIAKYVGAITHLGLRVEVRVEAQILGTGGGIKNTADFWDHEPFVVMNGDILTDLDLSPALERHHEKRLVATLVLHDRHPFNKIRINDLGNILEIPRDYGTEGLAFTGIHIMEPEMLDYIPAQGFSDIVDCYRELIHSGEALGSYVARGHDWHDIGSIPDYLRANRELAGNPVTIGSGCKIDPSVTFHDWAVVGPDCTLARGVEIERSVLWEHVQVGEGVKIRDSIVTSHKSLGADLMDGTR